MQLPEQIETERLILKGLKTPSFQLAEDIYAVADSSRDHLREWLPWPDKTHSAEDEYTNFLVKWCQAHWEEGTGFAYLITSKGSDRILGCIDLLHISDTNRAGEIGYWLATDAVGHGYMQEAVHGLEAEAFKAGINRIIIRNDTQNLRSAHVSKRCGYILEGIMRQDAWDDYHQRLRDTNIWSKLKSDWDRSHQE